jgi:HK97 gp10 family phage protein
MADDGGLSRFQQRMRAIPVAVREAVQPAVVRSAEEVAAMQRQLAPEDSGALKESIEVTPPGQATPAYSQPGGSRVAGELEAIVTAGNKDVRYPHLVEHGTTEAAAQPFFWPGFRLTRKRGATRIKSAISRAIRKNWGGK